MPSRSDIVLVAVLRAVRPLVRLLLRHGVAYPAFSTALKQVFLDAAAEELRATGKKQTGSAISLLSGVHRRDVRNLVQAPRSAVGDEGTPMNMASQVVARWLSDMEYLDEDGAPRALPRTGGDASFDTLVEGISRDIRPRAVLDELVRLGIAEEGPAGVRLLAPGFAPRQGFDEMARLLQDNLHDHAAAACRNLDGEGNFLEQAVFSGDLTPESVAHLHATAARVWRDALKVMMREARRRYDHDQLHADAAQRSRRFRFGAYFHEAKDDDEPAS